MGGGNSPVPHISAFPFQPCHLQCSPPALQSSWSCGFTPSSHELIWLITCGISAPRDTAHSLTSHRVPDPSTAPGDSKRHPARSCPRAQKLPQSQPGQAGGRGRQLPAHASLSLEVPSTAPPRWEGRGQGATSPSFARPVLLPRNPALLHLQDMCTWHHASFQRLYGKRK